MSSSSVSRMPRMRGSRSSTALRRKRLVHECPEPRVVGGVEKQHGELVRRRQHGMLPGRQGARARIVAEVPVVAQDGIDIGVAGEQPGLQQSAAMHRIPGGAGTHRRDRDCGPCGATAGCNSPRSATARATAPRPRPQRASPSPNDNIIASPQPAPQHPAPAESNVALPILPLYRHPVQRRLGRGLTVCRIQGEVLRDYSVSMMGSEARSQARRLPESSPERPRRRQASASPGRRSPDCQHPVAEWAIWFSGDYQRYEARSVAVVTGCASPSASPWLPSSAIWNRGPLRHRAPRR